MNWTPRTKLGLLACGFLTIAVLTYGMSLFVRAFVVEPAGWSMRIGGMFFMLWLAWPELCAIPRWLFYAILPTVIICAFRPVLLLYIIPVVIAYLYLAPKKKK